MTKKILIVDDEPMILKQLEQRLVTEGYEIVKATNGDEAVQKALESRPDLVIMDILMPGMDGLEAVTSLRQHRETKDTPVIFLTALQRREDEVKQGHKVGKELIFAKPFDGKELVENIRKLLEG